METTPRQSAHRPIKLIDPSSIAESEGMEPSNSPGAGGGDLAGLVRQSVQPCQFEHLLAGLVRLELPYRLVTAARIRKSATAGFFGSSEPCMYVPMTLPTRAPSV